MGPIEIIKRWKFSADEADHKFDLLVLADYMSDNGFDRWEAWIRSHAEDPFGSLDWSVGIAGWHCFVCQLPFAEGGKTFKNDTFNNDHGVVVTTVRDTVIDKHNQYGVDWPAFVGRHNIWRSARRRVERLWLHSPGRIIWYDPELLIRFAWDYGDPPYTSQALENGRYRLLRAVKDYDFRMRTNLWREYRQSIVPTAEEGPYEFQERAREAGWHISYEMAVNEAAFAGTA